MILDNNTLSLYLLAGGLSMGLSLVLILLAHLQPGSRIFKSCAIAIVLLSVGFTVSGLGESLPRWATVMGTNMILLSAGAVLYAGFAAHCEDRPSKLDVWGWGIVALTAGPFWYWGLIEPDGPYRSAVFSWAAAIINGRTAWVMLLTARQFARASVLWLLAALFCTLTIWMAVRGGLSMFAEAAPPTPRGANPTSWITVFWYIILVTLMVGSVIWLEFGSRGGQLSGHSADARKNSGAVDFFRKKLQLLWATVMVLILGLIGQAALFYVNSFDREKSRLSQAATLTTEAFAHQSEQLLAQADNLLLAVRGFYSHTGSLSETELFINSLPFDRASIENIYLISAQGQIMITHDPQAVERSVADRDYFVFHQTVPGDEVFISSVEMGRVTGRNQFRVTRRISRADGSFAGVVLATMNPESFIRYCCQIGNALEVTGSLIGTRDHKLRARVPEPSSDRWQVPIDSPLWDALLHSTSGIYKNISMVDEVPRIYSYRQLGTLPLVMVTGFSETDIRLSMQDHVRWIAAGVLGVLAVVLALAGLLTIEIRRRNEQDNFMSMLSHELKTPLSVLRIALEQPTLSDSTRLYAQKSVRDLDAVIYRCLQVDRLHQKSLNVNIQFCQVCELLDDLKESTASPQRLQIDAAVDLPAIYTDPQLLSMVLNNLMDNALKYAKSGSQVDIGVHPYSHHGRAGILVSVSNVPGAAGMPDPRQVFKKYYRSSGAHSQTGSGLGLYLVRNVVRLLGGWVRYKPTDGIVQFEIWLPL